MALLLTLIVLAALMACKLYMDSEAERAERGRPMKACLYCDARIRPQADTCFYCGRSQPSVAVMAGYVLAEQHVTPRRFRR